MELICPYCGHTMVPGRVSIHGREIDFLLVGVSSQELWFAPDSNPEKEVRVLASWGYDESEGHRCTNCCAMLLKGERPITQSEARKNEQTLRDL